MSAVGEIVKVAALCVMSAAVGGLSAYAWQQHRVSEAQREALTARGDLEDLVAAKTKAEAQRDAAQREAAEQRQAIYAIDTDAQAWGAAAVPDALADRVRRAAAGTDAAATTATGERGDKAGGVPANTARTD